VPTVQLDTGITMVYVWRAMRTAIATITALVCLTMPATALPNEKPSTDGILWNAVAVADSFWAGHGYPATCLPQVHTYDWVEDTALARADIGGCHVWVQQRTLKNFTKVINHAAWSVTDKRYAYRDLCKIMVHERGHNLGFEHEDGSVMDGTFEDTVAPGVCWDWAVLSVKKPKPIKRKRRR
jgi:hypothetical protein